MMQNTKTWGIVTLLLFILPSKEFINPGFVRWNDFYFFPANWIVFAVVYLAMFLMVGIVVWKMFCVVYFMSRLDNH